MMRFPVANRPEQKEQPNRSMLKTYLNRNKGPNPLSWLRFADFHMLCFIAAEFDVETAFLICDAIKEREDVPEGVLLILENM